MPKHHFIYRTTCIVTGKYYIGMHSTDDINDGYLGSGKIITRSIEKHGKENHTREILEDCSSFGREFLCEREIDVVSDEILNDPLCMNLNPGGKGAPLGNAYGSRVWTKAQREILSDACKGRKLSEETKKKIAATLRGRKLSDEHRQKISQGFIGKTYTTMGLGNKNKKFSAEHKRKISDSIKRYHERKDGI